MPLATVASSRTQLCVVTNASGGRFFVGNAAYSGINAYLYIGSRCVVAPFLSNYMLNLFRSGTVPTSSQHGYGTSGYVSNSVRNTSRARTVCLDATSIKTLLFYTRTASISSTSISADAAPCPAFLDLRRTSNYCRWTGIQRQYWNLKLAQRLS